MQEDVKDGAGVEIRVRWHNDATHHGTTIVGVLTADGKWDVRCEINVVTSLRFDAAENAPVGLLSRQCDLCYDTAYLQVLPVLFIVLARVRYRFCSDTAFVMPTPTHCKPN